MTADEAVVLDVGSESAPEVVLPFRKLNLDRLEQPTPRGHHDLVATGVVHAALLGKKDPIRIHELHPPLVVIHELGARRDHVDHEPHRKRALEAAGGIDLRSILEHGLRLLRILGIREHGENFTCGENSQILFHRRHVVLLSLVGLVTDVVDCTAGEQNATYHFDIQRFVHLTD